MTRHEKFNITSLDGLARKNEDLGAGLSLSEDVSILFDPIAVAGKTLANRFVVNPMESADADDRGAPTELTFRRYRRFAAGGSAIVWFEATAVAENGRSNPHQLYINERSLDGFKRLTEETRREAGAAEWTNREPLFILQLTHSGRYAKPRGTPAAVIARHDPHLDGPMSLPPDHLLITDSEIDRLQETFVAAALLAQKAGFNGVDVKACNGYLVSELLGAFRREKSRYGGPFENRTRFLLETLRKIKSAAPGLILSCRLSAYDSIPFPYGFGVDKNDPEREDLAEPKALVRALIKLGIPLLHLSLGNPRYKAHIGRPFDKPVPGGAIPDEYPLIGVGRQIRIAAEIQKEFPNLPVVGSGYSWLRRFFPNAAAGSVRDKKISLVGLGRESFAYPEFARELAERSKLDPKKLCLACSKCSELLSAGRPAGCPVRDGDHYLREYRSLSAT